MVFSQIFLKQRLNFDIMEPTDILLRYGEIFLKGKNQKYFENRLVSNIKTITHIPSVTRLRGRYIVPFFPDHKTLRNVFGLTSYSLAFRTEKDIESIQEMAVNVLSGTTGTVRVETKRADKRFPLTSPEINTKVGQHIEKQTPLTFSFSDPTTTLYIEINQEAAFLYMETIPCHGGLPTGVEGEVSLLVEDEASILAGLLFMKRGCTVFPIMKQDRDISLLEKYSPQKLVVDKHVSVKVSGQTLDSYQHEEGVVLRPLVGFSREQVVTELAKFT